MSIICNTDIRIDQPPTELPKELFVESRNTLTFVTCYLHDKNDSPHNDEWNVGRLAELVSIGIPLYIFVSPENADEIAFLQGATNIHIEVIDKTELWVFKQLSQREYSLPNYRNLEKDTGDYLAISNSKVELVSRVIEHNPWKTGHFAYIDFNITYLFWEKMKTYEYLHQMAKRTFFDKMLIFPGCSSPVTVDNIHGLADTICWRFCGGFFAGDANSLKQWWKDYQVYFVEYLDTYQKLTWDVNVWAWIETIKRWQPKWYSANHNDSIVTAVSADLITKNMGSLSRRIKHNYPVIPQFRPTSASYVKTSDGRRWLNTRYVNYWLYNNGCYGYPTSSHIIENKNMLCELDKDYKPIADTFVVMNEKIDIPKYSGDVFSQGLEDVRLYRGAVQQEYGLPTNTEVVKYSGDPLGVEGIRGNSRERRSSEVRRTVKFIATNVDYSPNGKNNMVIGDYSVADHTISNVKVVLPPVESWCEKNWIPISSALGEDLFIYKWSPFEVGRINPGPGGPEGPAGTLEIVMSHPVSAPFFNKVRGSTTFIEREDGLLGVVHFSEDHNPRHYYHILVLLEKESLRPLKYSDCFCFKSLGVEFCIGFADISVDNVSSSITTTNSDLLEVSGSEEYVFWTSHMDRDPMTVFINKSELPLCFDF
jgi:hypothetical protein